jgi:hypothetical protein
VSEQASAASAVVDEAFKAGLDGSHPLTLQAKMLRLELLNVKADLERELGWSWTARIVVGSFTGSPGSGVTPGHWAHREPAPHGDPVLST